MNLQPPHPEIPEASASAQTAAAPDAVLDGLEPRAVWRHFATLCAIPRPSKHEAALCRRLADWATARGIAARRTTAGNLILEKPASPGRARAPGVILQAHLDMVCQQQSGHAHDFLREPIRPEREGGWLLARNTTLGADNGIGVALALAVLEDDALPHGPLSVLLTVDEEAGMGGARGLAPGDVHGRFLLNLDSEEWGTFYLGCAGGVDVLAHLPAPAAPTPAGWLGLELRLDGLTGGHSGLDIDKGRAHAIRLLVDVLGELAPAFRFAVARLEGGTLRNALPRSAAARLCLPPQGEAAFRHAVSRSAARLQAEYRTTDPNLTLTLAALAAPPTVIDPAAWREIARLLGTAPGGVLKMSADFPDVVETSCNLGTLRLAPGGGTAGFLLRSLDDAKRDALAARLAAQIDAAGGQAEIQGAYPGWTPRPDSPLLAHAQAVFTARHGAPAKLRVIHAGLECGLIGELDPQLDMLSFGPDIRGAHAPGERVDIASVGRCWEFLTALLDHLAPPERESA